MIVETRFQLVAARHVEARAFADGLRHLKQEI
jgi:hypothetical protein